MAIELTPRTLRALDETNIEPNIIVKIDGYNIILSTLPVQELIRIGDPNLFIDGSWFIGGLRPIEDNRAFIDADTTTFKIQQQINYDRAQGSSISSMTIGLVDKDEFVTRLISPGVVIPDILGRKVTVFVTYGVSSFFEDSIEVFKGSVTRVDAGAGNIKLKINHSDNKKKVELFKKADTGLTADMTIGATTAAVSSASMFALPVGAFSTYIRIDNELIQYTGISSNTLTGLVRGQLGSTAAIHATDATVSALYCIEGNPLDIALQLMMSDGTTDPTYEDIVITSIVRVGAGSDDVANSIFFRNVDVELEYNITAGDTATITGATNGANNITTATVIDVQQFEDGYYVQFSGVSMVLEETTSATVNFFSQYNVLPDGMSMKPDEVDIQEHIRVRDAFHSATQMRIYIKEEETSGKEFLEEELYKPIACYSLPRKARASLGYTIGPIPGQDIKTLDETNIRNPDALRIYRSTGEAFYNEVFYKFEDTPLVDSETFTRGELIISQTSKDRIPGTTNTFIIESKGLRDDLNAINIASSSGQRLINRYQFGAQKINPKVMLSVGVGLEIGDIVVCDLSELSVTDITRGDRRFQSRFFEIQNKAINVKTGEVDLVCLDTGLGLDTRFALMSPCSPIRTVVNTKTIIIGPDATYTSRFGDDEFRKWDTVIGPRDPISIRIHNADYSIDHNNVVTSISGNTFILQDDLPGTIASGFIVEFTGYTDTDTSDKQKLIYGYMTDAAAFPDGGLPYSMI